jgi:hypothetical protein
MRPIRFCFVLALVAALAAAAFAPTRAQSTDAPAPAVTNPPLPSPRPTAEDPAVRKLAVHEFLAWQTGTVDRGRYADTVNNELSDDLLDRATKTLANLGALQQATFRGVSKARGVSFYVYHMACQNGAVEMEFSMDPAGKIALIFFE